MTAMNATIDALPESYTPTLADLRRADQTRRAIKAGQAPSLEDLRHLTAIRKGQAPTQLEAPNAMQAVLGFRPGTLDPSMSSQPADATTYPDGVMTLGADARGRTVDPGTSTVAPGAVPTDLDALGGLARSPFALAKQGAGLLVGAEQALAGPFGGQAVVGPALVRGISRAADQMAPAPQTFLGRAAEQTLPLAAGIAGGAAMGGATALGRTLASGAVAGAQSAGGTAAGAIDRGLSPEQAAKEAAVSGVTGAVTGALPLGRFASRLAGGNPVGGVLGDVAAQAAAGTAQSLADAAAASWIEQNPEQWRQAVAGMGETAAMNLVLGLVGHGVTMGGTKPQQLPRSGEVLYGGATNEPPSPARQPAATEPITPAAVESANGQETQGRQEGLLRQPVPASPGETTPGAAGAMEAQSLMREAESRPAEAAARGSTPSEETRATPPAPPESAGPESRPSNRLAEQGVGTPSPNDTGRVGPPPETVANPPGMPKGEAATPNVAEATPDVAPPEPNQPGFLDSVIAKAEKRKAGRKAKVETPAPESPSTISPKPTKRTTIDKSWHGEPLYAWSSLVSLKLRKGAKAMAETKSGKRGMRTMPALYRQQLDIVPTDATRLVDYIRARTPEVWKLEGSVGRGHTLVPRDMIAEAKAAVPDWEADVTSAQQRRQARRDLIESNRKKRYDAEQAKKTAVAEAAAKAEIDHAKTLTPDEWAELADKDHLAAERLARTLEAKEAADGQPIPEFDTADLDRIVESSRARGSEEVPPVQGDGSTEGDTGGGGVVARRSDERGIFRQPTEGLTGRQRGLMDVAPEPADPTPAIHDQYPGIRKGETPAAYEKRMGTTDTPSFIESAADATIAAAEARKAERRKALAEARSKAKKGDRLGASILPDIVDDVVIVAAKAVKAGARGAEAIRRMVREHFGSDNPDAEREITRILSASTTGDRYDNARFNTEIQKLYGRPDLANPATAPEARDFVDTVDALRNASGKPERRADVDVEKDATDRLAKDYEGEKKRLIEAATKGTTPTDVDTVIARKIVEDSALKAVREGSSSDYMEALTIANAYRDQGAEIARAFRQRRDKVMSPAEREDHAKSVLAQILTTPSPEIRQRLGRIRDQIAKAVAAGDEARANRFREAQTKTLQKAADTAADVKQKMKDMGVDPETITSQDLADPDKAARIARAQSTAQSSVWDMVHEYWVNSILSGPLTHVANIIGNTGYGAWDLGVNKLLSVATGKALGGKDTGTVGEWAETLKAFGPSLAEATRSFARTFATETPVFSEQARGYSDPSQPVGVKAEIQGSRATIPGKTGRVIRTPGRLLMATDEFFKTVYTKMVIHGEAYRAAVREGKSGAAARARAAELAQNPTAEMWGEAVKTAERLTFQDQSELANVLGDVKNALPGLRYVIPFIRTPLNIFKAGVGMTPLGLFSTVAKVARAGLVKMDWAPDTGWTYTRRNLASDLSKNLLSVGAAALLYGLMDDKDPRITGSAARETGKRAGQYRTAPPYSVRIGDSWYSYKRVEPFAVTLSSTVDLLDGYRNADDPEKKVAALAKAVQGIGKQGLDKTFLKGLGDMFGAIENQSGSGKEAVQYLSNFATGFVPNIIRQPMQAMDPIPRDMTVRPDDAGYIGPVLKNAARRAFPIGNLPPRMDVWGRVVENRPTGNVATDTLYRMLLPIQKMPANETLPVDRLLVNWNNKVEDNPDGVEKSWWPAAPTNLVTIEEKKYRLTEGEYVRYVKESGRQALENLSFSEDEIANPEPSTIRTIQSILRSTRRDVAEQIINDRKSK